MLRSVFIFCFLNEELINRSRSKWQKYQEERAQVQKYPGGDGREGGGTEAGRKGPCTCPSYHHFQGLFGLVGYVQDVGFWVLSL